MIEFFNDEIRQGHLPITPITPTFLAKVKLCEKIFPATPPLVMDRLIKVSSQPPHPW